MYLNSKQSVMRYSPLLRCLWLCIRVDRWESNRNCWCGRKRKCDSRLTPLITDEEDSAELCRRFLLPQCGVCLMPSSLHYSRHTAQSAERDSQSEKERNNGPLLSDILLQGSHSVCFNIRHLFPLSVFSYVDNIKQHAVRTPVPFSTLPTPHQEPQSVPDTHKNTRNRPLRSICGFSPMHTRKHAYSMVWLL